MEREHRAKVWGILRIAFSLILCLFTVLVYWFRSDALYGYTIWPAFVWAIPGIVLIVYRQPRRRWLWALPWLLVVGIHSEEPKMVLRSCLPFPKRPAESFRVITINASSNIDSVREAAQWKPDLVLVQESPDKRELERLAHELWGDEGSVVAGVDASIMAKGQLTELGPPRKAMNHTIARWNQVRGFELNVVSLRLNPPTFRIDYYNPDCWRDYAANRRDRRKEVADLWEGVAKQAVGRPFLMGGDYNTPPDRDVFRPLEGQLNDVFAAVGRGWPGTAVNDYPFARIDQLWTNREIVPSCAWVVKTRHTDHRMVVFDLAVRH